MHLSSYNNPESPSTLPISLHISLPISIVTRERLVKSVGAYCGGIRWWKPERTECGEIDIEVDDKIDRIRAARNLRVAITT